MPSYVVLVLVCLAVTSLSPGVHCRRSRYGRYLYQSAKGLHRRAPDGLETDVDDRVLNDQVGGGSESRLTQIQTEPVEPDPDPEDLSSKRSYLYNPSRSLSKHKSSSDPSRQNPSRSLSAYKSSNDPSRHYPSRILSAHKSSSELSRHNPSRSLSAHKPSSDLSRHYPSRSLSTFKSSSDQSRHKPSRSLSTHESSSVPSRYNPSRSLATHKSSSNLSRHNPSRSLPSHESSGDLSRFGTSRRHGKRQSRRPGHSKRTYSDDADRVTDLERMEMPHQKRTSGDDELDTLNGADETSENARLASEYNMYDYISK